ncbi:6-phosphogluconolactonase [Thorsellia anophelis]|uniref:6-phosphogluconolactonase n=1 Tax=Thorsellia anophelis DSM 18579 TaxID=1123402 RepID=A0A1I0C7I6_9GAMM|nr:6-phosphogluconolactonase [Thorsellia anophelis]SET15420.1 6-phosphogluconolactonase [Thorsellia anophelis DSM 18579]
MNQYIYIACPDSQEIHVFELQENGTLTSIQIVSVPGQVQPMTISPNGDFLYVGVRPDFRVLSYKIENETGKLSHAGTASLTGSPTHVSTCHKGEYFFSASYSFNCTSISPILPSGVIGEPIHNIEGLQAPHSANMNNSNQLLMIPALKEDAIRIFTLNHDGSVYEHSDKISTQTGAGPRHMAFHKNGKLAYCINELNSTIDVIELPHKDKTAKIIQTFTAVPDDFNLTCWSADIHITPNNEFLYCSERTSSLISAFKLNADGSIKATIGHFKTEEQPRGFGIDKSSKYLIATGQKSDFITVHKINEVTGELTELERYKVGKGAMWVTIR